MFRSIVRGTTRTREQSGNTAPPDLLFESECVLFVSHSGDLKEKTRPFEHRREA